MAQSRACKVCGGVHDCEMYKELQIECQKLELKTRELLAVINEK